MHYCYILYSKKIDRFYIGETEDFVRRYQEHLSGYFKHSFTSRTDDWELYMLIECSNRFEARKLENFLKRMKSRTFIQRLKSDPFLLDEIMQHQIRGS
ncbi:MAG: GIY-YIG nuclease family protein [Bacteroidales bacterium]|nr:GIY-YIG nuclease family protein [Bacteroidales bacterium]